MSRGTIYTIYKSVNDSTAKPLDQKTVLENWIKSRVATLPTSQKFEWDNLPDVMSSAIVNGTYDSQGLDSNKNPWTAGKVEKSTGATLAEIASWGFCSNSVFVFEDILHIGCPEERIFSIDECRDFVEAIDLSESAEELKRVAGGKFFSRKCRENVYLSNIVDEGLLQIFSTNKKRDAEVEYEDSNSRNLLLDIRDIMNTYLRLSKSDGTESWRKEKDRFILTGTYYY